MPTLEAGKRLVEAEKESQTHCLFLQGFGGFNVKPGTHQSIEKSLSKVYGGKENVIVFNSIISPDKPNPQRFLEIEKAIKEKVKDGPLDIVAHSLGAVELAHVLTQIEKKDPGYFDEQNVKDNLRIVLIGPGGFSKGLLSRVNYARNAFLLNTSKGKAYDALTGLPPKGVDLDSLSMTVKISNKSPEIPVVVFQGKDNGEFLSEKEKLIAGKYDAKLSKAVEGKKRFRTRKILRKRGKDLDTPVQRIFGGRIELREKESLRYGGKMGRRILLKAGGVQPMKEYLQLDNLGIRVDILVPEYDFTVPLKKVLKFYEEDMGKASSHIKILEGVSHAGIALQPDFLAETIKNSR